MLAIAGRMREHGTVSYDPNIRPALMKSPDAVMDRVEHLVALSDVVKASDEDVGWLYPGTPVEDVMRRWVKAGSGDGGGHPRAVGCLRLVEATTATCCTSTR